MDPMVLTILMFSLLVVLVLSGLPIAFALSGISIIFVYFLWGASGLIMLPNLAHHAATNYVILAVPLFVFMACVLEGSGMAEELYETMYSWLGTIPGGLASGTIVICALLAAMSGLSAVATITMGLIAMPSMIKRGYDRKMVIGGIACGGALGILIPPSVVAVIYCSLTGTSVGKLFMGGFAPGIAIAAIAMTYITIICIIYPQKGPTVPKEERVGWLKKIKSLKNVVLPILLILAVLGTIYTGLGTPTEAAGIGALGAIIVAAINRKLSLKRLHHAGKTTLALTSMILFLMIGAGAFSSIYTASGAADFILQVVEKLALSPLASILFMQVAFLFLGMLLDPIGMLMICLPIFSPVLAKFNINMIWFGILFLLQCEIAYLTPPFGFNLFYMKAICGKEVSMTTIYRSVIPFVFIQIFVLIIFILFPKIALWLPNMVGG